MFPFQNTLRNGRDSGVVSSFDVFEGFREACVVVVQLGWEGCGREVGDGVVSGVAGELVNGKKGVTDIIGKREGLEVGDGSAVTGHPCQMWRYARVKAPSE